MKALVISRSEFLSGGMESERRLKLSRYQISEQTMSVFKINDLWHDVTFKKTAAYLKNMKQEIVAVATRKGDLYFIQGKSEEACIAETYKKSQLITWHERFGHLNEKNLKQMFEKNTGIGMKLSKTEQLGNCEIYVKWKQAKNHLPKRMTKRSSELLESCTQTRVVPWAQHRQAELSTSLCS